MGSGRSRKLKKGLETQLKGGNLHWGLLGVARGQGGFLQMNGCRTVGTKPASSCSCCRLSTLPSLFGAAFTLNLGF